MPRWPEGREEDPYELRRWGEEAGDYREPEDPQLIHDPGFAEEEVDDWPDPDVGHEGHPLPFGTPVYNPGGGYDDYDPHSSENLPDERHEEHRVGGILRQSEQWPERCAGIALDPGEFLYMRDPAQVSPQSEGHTVYDHAVGGDPHGAVSVRPRDQAGPHDAFVMPGSESGLGYDAVVRHSPDGKGYDVIEPLDEKGPPAGK